MLRNKHKGLRHFHPESSDESHFFPKGFSWNCEELSSLEFPQAAPLTSLHLLPVLQSQQKCIVVFALVCCFAILVALIFSAVDIMGEDEDGLSEKNCQNKCR